MMEALRLILGQDKEFLELVYGGLPQASGITIATKDDGTERHMPIAVIAFTVVLPDGSQAVAQATMSVRQLIGFYSAMKGRYGPGGPEGHRMPGEENPFVW